MQTLALCVGSLANVVIFLLVSQIYLISGRRETLEWVGGCNQMAEYYTHTNELPLAQYLLLCAHSTLQSVKEKYDKSKVEHKYENEEDLRSVDAAIALSWAKLYSKRLQIAAHPGSETSPLIHKVPEDMR